MSQRMVQLAKRVSYWVRVEFPLLHRSLGSLLGVAVAAEGKLRPQIEKLLPLSRAAEPRRLVESGEVRGKFVLDPTMNYTEWRWHSVLAVS